MTNTCATCADPLTSHYARSNHGWRAFLTHEQSVEVDERTKGWFLDHVRDHHRTRSEATRTHLVEMMRRRRLGNCGDPVPDGLPLPGRTFAQVSRNIVRRFG